MTICPPKIAARLDAYARGVNAFIAQHPDSLPPEFALLHYEPQSVDRGGFAFRIGMMMIETCSIPASTSSLRASRSRKDYRTQAGLANLVSSWIVAGPPAHRGSRSTGASPPLPPPVNEDDEDDDPYPDASCSPRTNDEYRGVY